MLGWDRHDWVRETSLGCWEVVRMLGPVKRHLWLILLAASGCSPAWYKNDADLQVNALVRDREKQTLDYTPQVEVNTELPPKPAQKVYARLPLTPKPPPTTAPVAPEVVPIKVEPLGPPVPPPGANGQELRLDSGAFSEE